MNTALVHYLITFESQPKRRYFVSPIVIEKGKKYKILSDQTQVLEGKSGAELLEKLLETERLHFSTHRAKPLKKGKTQQGKLDWITEPEGKKRLHCRVSGGATTILPLEPLWYIDHISHECGELEVPLDPEVASVLLFAPPMSDEEIREIYLVLKNSTSEKERQENLKKYLQKHLEPISEKNISQWYCNWVSTDAQKNWFDFEMGIEYEGKQINLLPLLADFVQSQLAVHSIENIAHLPDDKIFHINLPNQKQLAIPVIRLKKILSILTELYQEDGLSGNEKLRVSKLRALQLAKLKEALQVKKLKWHGENSPQLFIKKFEKYKNKSSEPIPEDFKGELRYYQQEGVHWLQFLKETELSGILADDMGLGKTVQVLVHLAIEKNKLGKKKPSLIIAPTSLIMNWMREAQRFVPSLKILILHGQFRKENFKKIKQYDVVLTTYALLIRDEEVLLKQSYNILILDEAQYIKNITSKVGQIARKLIAAQRLCLTGTPMENNLGELWALFHFLLPGLLGDRRQFHQLFRNPIESLQDQERLGILKQRIAPFFLRRTKKEVLTELPDKIEMLRPVLLTDTQRELYENIRIVLHQKVLSAIQREGISKSQIFILDALLKLRQICCDPRLLKIQTENYEPEASAKLQLLNELLPNLILQGRKILLFSQFTEMLGLIENFLSTLNINYLKLTGKTQNRDEIIQKFQAGESPLFLISLKAGGVGLNLTQADTVIHYDPWWNPAVENQATDRAHRLGQDKTVFVYKLITAGTIEEKIMALQEEKKTLLEAVLSGNHTKLSSLSEEDIAKLFEPLSA